MLRTAILATMAATVALLWGLANSVALDDAVRERQLDVFERGEMIFMNRGPFIEFEDRLLIDVLPHAEHRGGVYFVGSSNMKWALKLWEVEDERRAWLHNYGIGATNHRHHLEFLRFLVERRGLLDGDPADTLVVLGVSYRSAVGQGDAYFQALWRRHGVYAYVPGEGPRMLDLSAPQRMLRLARARISSFVGVSFNRLARTLALALGIPLSAGFDLTDPAGIERVARRFDLPDPETHIAEQVGHLDTLVGWLRERGAGVALVVLPERATVHERTIPRAYRRAVAELGRRHDVPVLDLTAALAEDEFIDYNHANVRGLDKLHPIFMDLADAHLRERGLLER